jgi:hypothetical protein
MSTFDPRSGSGIAGDSQVTHLNMTADVNRGDLGVFSGCDFIFGLSEGVSKQLIYVLQDFFQAVKLGKEFNDKLKRVNKEVVIMDEFAPDTQLLPQVVVQSIPVDHTPISLGNALGPATVNDQLFEVFGGTANMSTTLSIYDSGKANTCALADIIFLALMQYVPMRLGQQEMTVQPQVRFTNATKVTGPKVGGDVYKITLTVMIVGNWRQYLEIETVGTGSLQSEPTVE